MINITKKLSTEEWYVIANNIGDDIIRFAVLSLIESLEKDQVVALNHYLETEPTIEHMLQHFIDNYAQFSEILEKETELQKKRYEAVMQ